MIDFDIFDSVRKKSAGAKKIVKEKKREEKIGEKIGKKISVEKVVSLV